MTVYPLAMVWSHHKKFFYLAGADIMADWCDFTKHLSLPLTDPIDFDNGFVPASLPSNSLRTDSLSGLEDLILKDMPQLDHADVFHTDMITPNQNHGRLFTQDHREPSWHGCSHFDTLSASKSAKLRVLATVPSMLHAIVLPDCSASPASGVTVDHDWKQAIDGTMHTIHTLKDVLRGLSSCPHSDCQRRVGVDTSSYFPRHDTDHWDLYTDLDARMSHPFQASTHRNLSMYKTLYQPPDRPTIFLAVACYTQILQILIQLAGILRDATMSGNKPSVQLLDIQTTFTKPLLSPSVQTVFMAHLIKQAISELSIHGLQLLQAAGRSPLAARHVSSTRDHDSSIQGMCDEIKQLEFGLQEALSMAINTAESVVA
jgi:hypothetical protein